MNVRRIFSITSLIAGIIAFLAATQITLEKIDLLKNPHYIPSCSINPFIACGPIMSSWQASVFGGLPNSIIGMVGYGLVIAITFTSLFVKFPRWYWIAYTVGITLAMGFLVWLMTQALLVIGTLCIYCFCVWLCTILLFWFALGELTRESTRFAWVFDYKVLLMSISYVALLLWVFFAFQKGWMSLL